MEKYLNKLETVKALVDKTNKRSVLVIIQHSNEKDTELVIPAIRESLSNIICFAVIGEVEPVHFLVEKAVGIIDEIVIDSDIKRPNSSDIIFSIAKNAKDYGISFSTYSDFECWAHSALHFISQKEGGCLLGKKVLIFKNSALGERLTYNLEQAGAIINKECLEYDFLIGACTGESKEINTSEIEGKKFKRIYDIGIKNFSYSFIKSTRECGSEIYRSDDRAGIAGEIITIMETKYLVSRNLGRTHICDINIVSGGYVGEPGDIVVDNAFNPKVIFGIAAGNGSFKNDLSKDEMNKLLKIQAII